MMSFLTFNFHNLVGVKVESDDPFALQFFEREYHFSSRDLAQDSCLVALRWRRRKSSEASGKEYIFRSHKVLARWSYAIELRDNGIDIDAFGNHIAVPMVHHMLVHPGMRYLCSQRGAVMLHGSSVAVKGSSLVFTGMGGTGKTTISSLLLKHGGKDWQLHADDYVFLSKGPTSYAYMTRAHLYRDQARWVPAILSGLSFSERVQLEFFGRLRELTRDGIKWPLRIEASRLWPDHSIAPQANLAAVLLLNRGRGNQPDLRKVDSLETALDELIHMNFYEARHFIRLFGDTLEEPAQEKWLEDWKKNERLILSEILQGTSLYRLELPQQQPVTNQMGKNLVDLITPLFSDLNRDRSDG